MYKVLTLNNIAAVGLKKLPEAIYQVADGMADPDAILVRSHNMHDMEFSKHLKAIARAGAGTNNIPVDKLSKMGIPVFNAPGANANAVKELVIAGMLLASRNIDRAWEFTSELTGSDNEIHENVEKNKKQFVGFELSGRTLAVVGLGAVGVRVANAALALGMKVIGYDPAISVQRAWELEAQVKKAPTIEAALKHADFVTIHVPLIDATRDLLNAKRIESMKKGVVVLNFARDGIIDNEAMLKGLDDRHVHAYVCDFPTQQFLEHPRVIALPHLGASTREAEQNCATMAAEQLREFLEDGNIINSVNFPETVMQRGDNIRIAISNANVPNMVGQISTILGAAGINIIDLLNKSRGDVAYTLIDVHKKPDAKVISALGAIEGVLMLRVI